MEDGPTRDINHYNHCRDILSRESIVEWDAIRGASISMPALLLLAINRKDLWEVDPPMTFAAFYDHLMNRPRRYGDRGVFVQTRHPIESATPVELPLAILEETVERGIEIFIDKFYIPSPGTIITTKVFYDTYTGWYQSLAPEAEPPSIRRFSQLFYAIACKRVNCRETIKNGKRALAGLKPKPTP